MPDSGKDNQERFLYDAFISYRHVARDRKWAEWLIKSLESYRVPKALRAKGLPSQLKKIFRDEDEVPASPDLNDQIKSALKASRFLIVVCSAFTPRSKWVEREIEMFNELGRSDQVLALLTEGEPSDSFPDVMLVRHREVTDPDGSKRIIKENKEPLAADVRPRQGVSDGTLKRLALLRLVAVILGVKFDDLRQREHERQRKYYATWAGAVAALVLLIGSGAALYWNMMRPQIAYYRHLAWRWGVPEGVGRLDQDTHDHLQGSYEVTTLRGKVVRVDRNGSLADDAEAYAHWIVRYADAGYAEGIDIYDVIGNLVRREAFKPGSALNKLVVTFERNNVPLTQVATQNLSTNPYSSANRPSETGRTQITRHELTFDERGFVVELRYQDYWGTPQRDGQDSYGEHFEYSPEGLVLRHAQIGKSGEEITLKNGIRAVTFSFDSEGKLLRQTFLGESGSPTSGSDGYAYSVRGNYDKWGNAREQDYFGIDGKPAVTRDGYARLDLNIDENGNASGLSFYGADGEPTITRAGISASRSRFNLSHFLTEVDYFGVDGKPTMSNQGIAKRTQGVSGNLFYQSTFGLDGKPTLGTLGYASRREAFDAKGDLVEQAFFGVNGELVLVEGGYAGYRQSFDRLGHVTELSYFGTDRKPVASAEGLAKVTYAYDVRGNEIQRAFIGVDGKPTLGKLGYASFRQTFDDRGRRTRLEYFGIDGQPILTAEGIASFAFEYDTRGEQTSKIFHGLGGNAVIANSGYAGERQNYDGKGNIIRFDFLGTDGMPMTGPDGAASIIRKYDALGRETERAFLDAEGKPMLSKIGCAVISLTWDEHGHAVQTSCLGTDGRPVLNSVGYASIHRAYDARGYTIEESYYGAEGQPVMNQTGTAKTKYTYDALGRVVEAKNFGPDGKLIHGIGGYAILRQSFNSRGDVLSRSFFDVDGKPIDTVTGSAEVHWTYDPTGNLTEEAYFDTDGKPAHADGCVRIQYVYDRTGQLTSVEYFDSQNKKMQMELAVRSVYPGMAGSRAGLAPGDVILTYDAHTVVSAKQLEDLVRKSTKSFRVIEVRRGHNIVRLLAASEYLGAVLALVHVGVEPEAAHGLAPGASSQ